MRMRTILVAAGVLALAACDSGSGDAAAGGETGGMRVTVHNNTAANVDRVELTILADGNVNPNPAVDQGTITIDSGDAAIDPGPVATWEFTRADIPVGHYVVTAEAFNAGNEVTFESNAFAIEVLPNQAVTLDIFMHQDLGEDPLKTPHITAVSFDGPPVVSEAVTITVFGQDGTGALDLSATGEGDFGEAATATWDGEGRGDAKDAAGAEIDWVPDGIGAGDREVTVKLTDQDGNTTSLTMTVSVNNQLGDIDFTVEFNQAPEATVVTHIENDETDITVTMIATATDFESDPTDELDIVWNVEDCEDNANFTVTSTPASANGEVEDTLEADGTDTSTLVMTRASGASPIECTVEVTVSDRGLPGDAAAISSRTLTFELTAGTVTPTF